MVHSWMAAQLNEACFKRVTAGWESSWMGRSWMGAQLNKARFNGVTAGEAWADRAQLDRARLDGAQLHAGSSTATQWDGAPIWMGAHLDGRPAGWVPSQLLWGGHSLEGTLR